MSRTQGEIRRDDSGVVCRSSCVGVRVTTTDDALRDHVRASVLSRTPVDEREERSIVEFIEHFDRLERPFSEHAHHVHVTGSGIVVGARGVLLLKHKRLGFWLQPGGHVDDGETPWGAALRETGEETGIEVTFGGSVGGDGIPELLHVDVHEGGRGHLHLDLRYLIDAGDADPAPPADESQEIGWFDWETAVGMSDHGLVGILTSVRSNLR